MEYLAQMLAQHFKYPLPTTLLWNEYHMVFTSTWKFSDECFSPVMCTIPLPQRPA